VDINYKITIMSQPEQVLNVVAAGVKVEAIETIPIPPEPPPLGSPSIIISPASGPTGTVVQIKLVAFPNIPGVDAILSADWGESKQIDTFYYGSADAMLTVPAGTTEGNHIISAQAISGSVPINRVFTVTKSPDIPPPPPPPITETTLYIEPDSGLAGTKYDIRGINFGARAMVSIEVFGYGFQLVTEPGGSFKVPTAIPWDATPGEYTIKADTWSKKVSGIFRVIE
jgi:hypothetical protein